MCWKNSLPHFCPLGAHLSTGCFHIPPLITQETECGSIVTHTGTHPLIGPPHKRLPPFIHFVLMLIIRLPWNQTFPLQLNNTKDRRYQFRETARIRGHSSTHHIPWKNSTPQSHTYKFRQKASKTNSYCSLHCLWASVNFDRTCFP